MPKQKAKRQRGGLVYSTDGGRYCPQCRRPTPDCICKKVSNRSENSGIVRIRRETKGRGGKAVTVIAGLPGTADELKAISKELKRLCGVGGATKGREIEIQGDKRDQCRSALEARGYTVKFAGG